MESEDVNGHPISIHGADDRVDILAAHNSDAKAYAKSVVLIVTQRTLKETKPGSATFELLTDSAKNAYRLCDDVRFKEQPVPREPSCTGFLVGPDIIATAQHCLEDIGRGRSDADKAKSLRFLFGFHLLDGNPRTTFSAKDIYRGQSVVAKGIQASPEVFPRGTVNDWVLLRIGTMDKKTPAEDARKPLEPSCSLPKKGKPIYVIGHPQGLPQKYAPRGEITAVGPNLLTINLDVLGGNSGSPVFALSNAKTRKGGGVLGIWVGTSIPAERAVDKDGKEVNHEYLCNATCCTLRVCRSHGESEGCGDENLVPWSAFAAHLAPVGTISCASE